MAVIEYDEYKQRLLALEPTLGELEKALGIPKAREELAELQKETEQEGFWNDLERSQQVSRQVKRLENKIKKHDKLVSEWEDTLTLCEMAQEEDDPSQLDDVVELPGAGGGLRPGGEGGHQSPGFLACRQGFPDAHCGGERQAGVPGIGQAGGR